jgi:hypothetical protein
MKRKEEIQKELELLSPAVANLSLELPFAVPAGYFDEFPAHMASLMSHEEPVLSLPKENAHPQTAPAGYFESLPDKIMDRIRSLESSEEAPVVSISQSSFSWKRWAVAAVTIGILLTTGWMWMEYGITTPKQETVKVESNIPNVTDSELDTYFEETNLQSPVLPLEEEPQAIVLLEMDESTLSELLKTMGDEGLEYYIQDNPLNTYDL